MNINMTAFDFERLIIVACTWTPDISGQDYRFDKVTESSPGIPIAAWRTDWSYAYFVGDQWAAVIFAKSYLESIGEEYELLWDMANDFGSYVFITNYKSTMFS